MNYKLNINYMDYITKQIIRSYLNKLINLSTDETENKLTKEELAEVETLIDDLSDRG